MDTRTRTLDVYAWLKQQIMLSRYAPGQSVAELEVAAAMGCSQGTVREAMLRLQEELPYGLVVQIEGMAPSEKEQGKLVVQAVT